LEAFVRFRHMAAKLAGWVSGALALSVAGSALAVSIGPQDAFGDWLTANGKAVVRVHPCEGDALCGEIVWLRNEMLSGERLRNAEGELLRGARILYGFRTKGTGWVDGRVYALNQGKTYRAKVVALDQGRLRVEGCVGPFCGKQVWTRVTMAELGPRPVSGPQPTLVADVD